MGASKDNPLYPPDALAVFKTVPPTNLLDIIEIPERVESRKPTDKKFLIAFVASLALLIPFMTYTLVYSDIRRYFGYDECGNICGVYNVKYDEWECTGRDFTDKPYLQYDKHIRSTFIQAFEELDKSLLTSRRSCVETCRMGYTPLHGTCLRDSSVMRHFEESFMNDIKQHPRYYSYLHLMSSRITLACLLSIVVALVMLFLFRTFTAVMVWGIIAGNLLLGGLIVGISVYSYTNISYIDEQRFGSSDNLLYAVILSSMILFILFLMVAILAKRIKLVIALLKECTKAALAMPQLVVIPILTFIVQSIVAALLLITSTYMFTSGVLTKTPVYYEYAQNFFMSLTIIVNIVMALWAFQIVKGIQYMVIAGAVSKWYFVKNKEYLDRPLITSILVTFKYHLGSIACGSLIITAVSILRAIVVAMMRNHLLRCCLNHCLRTIESCLKYFSQNAYILIAMHGEPFIKSGKRATKIIFDNALNVVAVNFIGDFIIFMIKLLVLLISELITFGIMQDAEDSPDVWLVYLIVGIVSFCVANIFFSIFEATMDTMFLCFCEDSLINDGMARPYAMSTDLMEFVENSKKLIVKKK